MCIRDRSYSLTELKNAGVSLVNYSTPCLFAAQSAIENQMKWLKEQDGFLPKERVGVAECTNLLNLNLDQRNLRE